MSPSDLVIPRGSRTVWGIDVSHGKANERPVTWIAAAVHDVDGNPFVTVRTRRPGEAWVADYMKQLATESGHNEVVIRSKGAAAMGLIKPLQDAGLTVHTIEGGMFALATAHFKSSVVDERLVIVEQPDVDIAVGGAVVTPYADNEAWSQQKSLPLDISGVIAETNALWGLEKVEVPVEEEPTAPPLQAEVLESDDEDWTNLAEVSF